MRSKILVGGLGPLHVPGLTAAGQELLCAMTLAVGDLNTGWDGRAQVVLRFLDTGGSPDLGVEAASQLQAAGAVALVGEFHSVVADAVAAWDGLHVPFICSSATLDSITARRRPLVFRICPPQSRGWQLFAEHVVSQRIRSVVLMVGAGKYWASGAGILRHAFRAADVETHDVDAAADAPEIVEATTRALTDSERPALLVPLLGYPAPMKSVLWALRRFHEESVLVGDPAGRPIFPEWMDVAGPFAANVPFPSYQLPDGGLTERGRWLRHRYTQRFGREPTFVGFESYDAVACAATAAISTGDAEGVRENLRTMTFEGTRKPIRFDDGPQAVQHQQWLQSPLCVAVFRDPQAPFSEAVVVRRDDRS